MRRRGRLAWLAFGVLSLGVAPGAGAATGQQLFTACAACHGAKGEGNVALGAPAIAGQSEAYVLRQLQHFRDGLRGTHKTDLYGAQMRAANAAVLKNPADVATLAKHVASLPKTTVKPGARFDVRNGNNLYQGKCGACHGVRAEGNDAFGAPRLAGLDTTYLKRQLANFRAGVRGAHQHDTYGRQMSMMAPLLTAERDIDDVIGYVQSQGSAR